MNNVPEKKNRAKMRKCARLLVETHRSVRHSDGSVGKMVGAGEHMSYNGLVEASTITPHPSPLTPHLAPLTHSQPFKAEKLLPRKRKRGGEDDVASALALAANGFEVFAGARGG